MERDLQAILIDKTEFPLELLSKKIDQLQTKRRGVLPVKIRGVTFSFVGYL